MSLAFSEGVTLAVKIPELVDAAGMVVGAPLPARVSFTETAAVTPAAA
jgi:hypothetical protein